MTLFGLFGRKQTPGSVGSQLLSMAEQDADAFASFVESLAPGERLMILVGHGVGKPAIQATTMAAKQIGDRFELLDFVRDAENSYLKNKGINEVLSRRMWWCLVGACVFKFDSIEDEARSEAGGRLWAALLSSLSVAEASLAHNALWSDDEKSLFEFPDARMGMQIVGKAQMPPRFRNSQAMRSFAEMNDINLSGRF